MTFSVAKLAILHTHLHHHDSPSSQTGNLYILIPTNVLALARLRIRTFYQPSYPFLPHHRPWVCFLFKSSSLGATFHVNASFEWDNSMQLPDFLSMSRCSDLCPLKFHCWVRQYIMRTQARIYIVTFDSAWKCEELVGLRGSVSAWSLSYSWWSIHDWLWRGLENRLHHRSGACFCRLGIENDGC